MSTRPNSARALYPRATVVLRDRSNNVLLVKYRHSDEWELPGRRLNADTDPTHVLISTVSQRVGLNIHDLEFRGVHSGHAWFHCVFTARADGVPKPGLADVQDAVWWDVQAPLKCQPHVAACLAVTGYPHNSVPCLSENDPGESAVSKWEPRGRSVGVFLKEVLRQLVRFH